MIFLAFGPPIDGTPALGARLVNEKNIGHADGDGTTSAAASSWCQRAERFLGAWSSKFFVAGTLIAIVPICWTMTL